MLSMGITTECEMFFGVLLLNLFVVGQAANGKYYFDITNGFGRVFDGVGGISGGGATSKLLPDYPEPQKSDVLDFLFKPNFGASMQILKVEIGGDAQSSEGTESSHMHEEWDENYERGYEWWVMKEAKKRNPKIKLCGLSWGFPGWLSGGKWSPYVYPNKTAHYITSWILGAKREHGLDIDCIGIWNEKPYDGEYIKILRKRLNELGLSKVKIVAADNLPGGAWTIVKDMSRDEELKKAVDIIGVHYLASEYYKKAIEMDKPIWSSEDWSSDDLAEGGGCLAQLLNRNYVNGLYTSTIAWNMLYAYYPRMSYDGHGLMRANEPWSGHYEVGLPIWAMAHTTQFTEAGWRYLRHGDGVGKLRRGGTYVSLVSPDMDHFTIIIETMDTTGNRFCNRPPAFPHRVHPQTADIVLKGNLASNRTFLHVWRTIIDNEHAHEFFRYLGKVEVMDGKIKDLHLEVNSIYTLTTLGGGLKGSPSTYIPTSKRFPKIYFDDFERYPEYQEAAGFTQQIGAFEVRSTSDEVHKKVMRQVVQNAPIRWCPFVQNTPMGVIGDGEWTDISVSVDAFMPGTNSTDGVFVGARIDHGGCTTFLTSGIFFIISFTQQTAYIAYDMVLGTVVASRYVHLTRDTWYHMDLDIRNNTVTAKLNNDLLVLTHTIPSTDAPVRGYVSLGCRSFGVADFDNLRIKSYQ